MSTIDLHLKITGHEAKEWIRNCLAAIGTNHDDEEVLIDFISKHKPQDFKPPRKQRSSKTSEDRQTEAYNPDKCSARIWNKGLGAQCNKVRIGDSCFCKTHGKEADSHNGYTRFGCIDSDRFSNAYNDPSDDIHYWHDVERPKKKSSNSGPKAPRKQSRCSHCNQTGHNKRKCPLLASDNSSVQEFQQARVSLQQTIDNQSDNQSDICQPCTPSNDQVPLIPDNNDSTNSDDSQATVSMTDSQIAAAGCGLDIDDSPDQTQSNMEVIDFQGVEYLLDPEDNTVFTKDTYDEMGLWDGSSISFNSDEDKAAHDSVCSHNSDTSSNLITFEGIHYKLGEDGKTVYENEDDDEDDTEYGSWNGESIDFNPTGAKLHRKNKLVKKME